MCSTIALATVEAYLFLRGTTIAYLLKQHRALKIYLPITRRKRALEVNSILLSRKP